MAFSLGSTSTLIDYLVPPQQSRSVNLLKDGLLVIGFSLFLALCAQLSFHLSFTPVPITLQTLGVLLTSAALGSRRGAAVSYICPSHAPWLTDYLPDRCPLAGYCWDTYETRNNP